MSPEGLRWQALAEAEVVQTIAALPPALRDQANSVPVIYEGYPSAELEEDGVEPDTLGLFVGETWPEAGSTTTPLPGQIFLFVENLRDYAEDNAARFREEVRTTYLHELGHYLGLDEDDLTLRGLE
jgi:predicted Zn-dependent protease with MMP-like domain